ncbi:hypothetical protein DACRYDRAFT_21761 [Dacryopinax primogenitus]|uniref:Uncharacterized protein n=1 Tax=Dacryopinax primogenitus (strain DJM 731) TaxID=1858805 RepID=M5GDY6_DACPD|nr:uncharacterized protein DACRYDRAFT_21761 [Dacryopinax primogenitus]EJU02808.1 hypothetical protein DACRYDRAFT_21761 [Dacryopinax primogenitus]
MAPSYDVTPRYIRYLTRCFDDDPVLYPGRGSLTSCRRLRIRLSAMSNPSVISRR